MGAWSSLFSLSPNPNTLNYVEASRSLVEHSSVGKEKRFHVEVAVMDSIDYPQEFPRTLSILGFIPLRLLGSPPITLRFALLSKHFSVSAPSKIPNPDDTLLVGLSEVCLSGAHYLAS